MSTQFRKTVLLNILLLVSMVASGQQKFTNCSAVFIDDQMVVDEYSKHGRCVIDYNAKGTMTVQTANLSEDNGKPTGKIGFKLAIRDGMTNTLVSFSDKTLMEESIENILAKCKKGDSIVVMTTMDQYALTHNEIMIRYDL